MFDGDKLCKGNCYFCLVKIGENLGYIFFKKTNILAISEFTLSMILRDKESRNYFSLRGSCLFFFFEQFDLVIPNEVL